MGIMQQILFKQTKVTTCKALKAIGHIIGWRSSSTYLFHLFKILKNDDLYKLSKFMFNFSAKTLQNISTITL